MVNFTFITLTLVIASTLIKYHTVTPKRIKLHPVYLPLHFYIV